MKKIAFYLDNRAISDIDANRLEYGNPGIGGTEYLILLVSTMLARNESAMSVKLWITHQQKLPAHIQYSVVDNLSEAISQAEEELYDTFVLKHDANNIINDYIVTSTDLKFYIWCHVFICYWELDYYAKNPYVYKMVYVSREMLDLYRDHPLYKKSVYIYNCVNLDGYRDSVKNHPFSARQHIVTYVGSLVPFKGFHRLARIWPDILKSVPDAQLYVIGSGRLYNSSAVLGQYGIAEKSYEEYFMRYLSKDGHILSSVHFMGRMGVEKNEILLQTKVGVPNPTGITETFCLSAVEMQICGAVLATVKAPGYMDTVKNGILCSDDKSLTESIVKLLKTNKSNYNEAMDFFEKEFSLNSVLLKWRELLLFENKGKDKMVNLGYRLKWLKEIIRVLGDFVPSVKYLPPVERVLLFIERKIFKKITYMDSDVSL